MCIYITDSSRYDITPPTTESRNTCLSVDGQLHEDGDSWHDGCRLCYCYGGQEMCALISCPRPSCSIPVFRLGDCCPSCPGEQYCLFLKVKSRPVQYFFIQFSFIVILGSYSECDQVVKFLWFTNNYELMNENYVRFWSNIYILWFSYHARSLWPQYRNHWGSHLNYSCISSSSVSFALNFTFLFCRKCNTAAV